MRRQHRQHRAQSVEHHLGGDGSLQANESLFGTAPSAGEAEKDGKIRQRIEQRQQGAHELIEMEMDMLMPMQIPMQKQRKKVKTGRFAGSSTFWSPDYVGTLRLQSTGTINFTAVAEVELQRQPEAFPGAGLLDFEMRRLITLTSPLNLVHNGLRTRCQIQKPVVPVRIEHSGLRLYRGNEDMPKNSYELRVFQDVPLGECVSGDGQRFQRSTTWRGRSPFKTPKAPGSSAGRCGVRPERPPSEAFEQQRTPHHQRQPFKRPFHHLTAPGDRQVGAEIAARDRTCQQHRQPAPGDLPLTAEGERSRPIPEQPHQHQRVSHGAAVIQPEPAHQPERHEQAGA